MFCFYANFIYFQDVDSICSHLGGSKTTCDSTLCNVTGDGSQKSINSPHVKTERQDHIDLVVDAVHSEFISLLNAILFDLDMTY